MNNRPENKLEKTSACEILKQLLESPPIPESSVVGSVIGVSLGPVVINIPENLVSYDTHNTDVIRAVAACNEKMLVHPASTSKTGLFYISPEKYDREVEKVNEANKAAEDSWFVRLKRHF